MDKSWRPKPGDRFFVPKRPSRYRLRRVLGVFTLYSAGYGNVGSSIYYALGVVALVAMGATPVALGIAGILFIFTALTYAEGSAMFPEAGGSASFATHAFNELVGFASGWALMLSYIVTISISAYTIPPYLGYFWPVLKESTLISTAASMGIVLFLMLINIIGVREASFLNLGATIMDLLTQVSLIALGFLLLFNVDVVFRNITDYWPTTENLVFGIALATLAYTGVETMSQMAQETRHPEIKVPKALMAMIGTVLIIFAGISIVALSAMNPTQLATQWARDPVAGIAQAIPIEWVRDLFKPLVAILAATILLIAANAGLIGISRLAFFMGRREQIPSALRQIHPRFRTPYVSIVVFSLVAILILAPGFVSSNLYTDMGALYVFGSLLTFTAAHASILSLRVKEPGLTRPFKLKGNIKVKGKEIPITALLGVIATLAVWAVIVIAQPYTRWVGFGWMGLGLLIYCCYRKKRRLSFTREAPGEIDLT